MNGQFSWQLARLYTGLDTRADALLIGCFVALLAVWGYLPTSATWRSWARVAAPAAVILLALVCKRTNCWHPYNYRGLFTVSALCAGTIIVALLMEPATSLRRVLEWKYLKGVGKISYGLYLFHHPAIYFLHPEISGLPAPLSNWLALGASFSLAILSYHFVEMPFLRLKDRYRVAPPSPQAAPAASSSRAA